MKISTMKKIDKLIGTPLSILFLLYEFTKRIFIKRRRPTEFKKILVMKFFGMGSIILSIPLLNLIRKNFKEAEVTYLTFSQNKELLQQIKLADRHYFLRTDTFFHFIFDTLKILFKLRIEKYDAVLDLEFFSNFSLTMSYLSGAKWRAGYYVRGTARGFILDSAIYFNHLKHVSEVFAMLVYGLKDGAMESPQIEFNLLPFLNLKEEQFNFEDFGIENNGRKPLIVMNVNASELCKERRWPAENFVQLSEYLIKNYDALLLFTGAEYDREYVQDVIDRITIKENVVNLAGKTGLKELIFILKNCDIFISNDSGPLHLASLLDRPTVSFFGPETPRHYGPLNGRRIVFYKDVYCSPCLSVYNAKTSACNGRNICMREISVKEVIGEIERNFADILTRYNR